MTVEQIELADAFTNSISVVMTFFMAYLSATSAFLAVAFVAAPRLPQFLSRLIVFIYSFASLFIGTSFERTISFAASLQDQMRSMGMSWHPAIKEPDWLLQTSGWIGIVTLIMVYLASLAFYLHARRGGVVGSQELS